MKGRNIPVLGDGTNIYQFIHANDLANACILAGQQTGADIFHCVTEDYGTMYEVLDDLCQYADTGSKVVKIPMKAKPLIVDLDGTLLHTDLLFENIMRVIKKNPFYFFTIVHWLFYGKAYLKKKAAEVVPLDIKRLPYNHSIIEWIKKEKKTGRKIILATASNQRLAKQIAEYLGFFDHVYASDNINLSGKNKKQVLVNEFGENQFDYAANSNNDLPIWQVANRVILVNASQKLTKKMNHLAKEKTILYFPGKKSTYRTWVKALRVHQWIKNSLIFIPLLLSQSFTSLDLILQVSWGIVSFCLCSSSIYVFNDLIDLEEDRFHPTKQNAPLLQETCHSFRVL